ncbi:unnamed protein product [Brassica oleracea]|uniref:Uncharacterized protein n=2 Tax=Brassica TaxID=3705 RepID=A0A3P6EY00_BRAOL|nr:unnamed protein product [Brassica napus]VDD40961.1 unnamed protein product [Brassica oleracea]
MTYIVELSPASLAISSAARLSSRKIILLSIATSFFTKLICWRIRP